ncbi:MAG: DUF4404 family protein [Spirochaetales bacterium]|nr:DUF4404 family protein [Spirochaetales bacterium]
MINETIQDIEMRIQTSPTLDTRQKSDLLKLLTSLKTEVDQLSKTHHEDAASLTDFIRSTARESLKRQQNPKLVKISLEGVHASVEKFEASHPVLTETVNNLCNYFSGMGI